MPFNELLSKISFATFNEILSEAPRKVRESLYSHYGVKSKKSGFLTPVKENKEQKNARLKEKLHQASHQKELEFIKELIRNWLFHKRPMLKSALDFLQVENDNGLVEIETTFFKELDKDTVQSLIKHLLETFPKDDVMLYLYFMEVPNINEHF